MSAYVLTCNCEVELRGLGYRVVWVATKRCVEHATGPIPVAGMSMKQFYREADAA